MRVVMNSGVNTLNDRSDILVGKVVEVIIRL